MSIFHSVCGVDISSIRKGRENNLAVDPTTRHAALCPFGGVSKQFLCNPLAEANMVGEALTVQECSVCITGCLITFLDGIKQFPYQLLGMCTTCNDG